MNKSVNKPVAVIMCVYKNDKATFLREAIESVINQHGIISHLYVFVDGPITESLMACLDSYSNNKNFSVHFSEKNIGLASGLNWLIDNSIDLNCYDYVARMDADDISSSSRFIKQVELLNTSEALIVGSDCIEIDHKGSEVFYKSMLSEDLEMKSDIIKRCPFVHPSVMFSSSIFKSGHRYDSSLMNTQDYYLWVELATKGIKFTNINEPLLYFRVDENFHKRRGFKKVINEFRGRIFAMNHLKIYSFRNIVFTVAYFILRILPSSISKIAYNHLR